MGVLTSGCAKNDAAGLVSEELMPSSLHSSKTSWLLSSRVWRLLEQLFGPQTFHTQKNASANTQFYVNPQRRHLKVPNRLRGSWKPAEH